MTTSDPTLDPAQTTADLRDAAADTAGALFDIDGATEATSQWRAERFQLVNWGGFEGRVQFDFHPNSTLISGASGTGKSTLLDAYLALMMAANTPFNGASNDAVAGRARSAEQRNLLSYLRGQMDTNTGENGEEKAKVLRGDRTATWGAVGMTFVDDHQQRFTALRIYLVPARARTATDITMRMATYDGVLDLADLAEHAAGSFAPRALKATFPGLRTHDSYGAFSNTLYTRLGIGANGDGEKALRLLVRIQSGQQIRTVDELYKEMVLERPATYAAADRAIEHFDDLEAAYLAMVNEQAKSEHLAPITALHERLAATREELSLLDTFGIHRAGDTPLTLWSFKTEEALVEGTIAANTIARAINRESLGAAAGIRDDLDSDLKRARQAHHDAGGADLDALTDDITRESGRRDERLTRRAILADHIKVLDRPLGTREDFDALRANADQFESTHERAAAAIEQDRIEEVRRQGLLMDQRRTAREDLQSFQGRAGRVTPWLDRARNQAAQASGMDPDELPFVAELIDIAPEHTRWRTAIESVLGGSARLVLVPLERLDHFSVAVDALHLRGRLNFEGVPTAPHRDVRFDPDHVAGKLVLKASPYSGWIQSHVSDGSRNAYCVETARELSGPGFRVDLAGQTRRGTRGSIGRTDSDNVIGFDSTEAIADITARISKLETGLADIDTALVSIGERAGELGGRRDAYQAVRMARWDDIDVPSSDIRISSLTEARERILKSDNQLKMLQERIDVLEGELRAASEQYIELDLARRALKTEHGGLCERQDELLIEVDRIESSQRVHLSDEHAERITAEFAAAVAPASPDSYRDFTTNLARLQRHLKESMDSAAADIDRTARELERIFTTYIKRWDSPNLGVSVAHYGDYALILDNILTSGLHTWREEWRRRLTQWSGQDLVPLSGAMDAAIEEIEDRLEPINHILNTLPFGARNDRLQMALRRLTPEHVTQFRRDLRTLSSTATKELAEDKMEARFAELQMFMDQIRRKDDPRKQGDVVDRDRLLDVRKHVDITAERYDLAGERQSIHSALGGKSGGESQELVAFIVGAALRFRLGDELRTRPRFAPVFLDEGFVKSDAEFTGRAVQAWKGLGFQLIVGAPLDKVTALEPHMDELLAITKDTTTGYSFVSRITDPTRRVAR